MNMIGLYQVAVLALATAAVSVIISRAKISEPIRDRCRTSVRRIVRWMGELLSCTFCTSVWISGIATVIYRPRVLTSSMVVADVLVSWFAIVTLGTFCAWVVFRAYRSLRYGGVNPEEVARLRAALEVARKKLVEQGRVIKELRQ